MNIYTKRQLGIDLKTELDRGYNIKRISNWAHDLFFFSHQKFSAEISTILQNLFLMEAGPEFEETEEELRKLAENLINDEEN